MRHLTEQEFHDTFTDQMQQIDFDSSLLEMDFTSDKVTMAVPHGAFRNSTGTHEHHVLETEVDGVYLVFVRDLAQGVVDYHILDVHEHQPNHSGGSCGCGQGGCC